MGFLLSAANLMPNGYISFQITLDSKFPLWCFQIILGLLQKPCNRAATPGAKWESSVLPCLLPELPIYSRMLVLVHPQLSKLTKAYPGILQAPSGQWRIEGAWCFSQPCSHWGTTPDLPWTAKAFRGCDMTDDTAPSWQPEQNRGGPQ